MVFAAYNALEGEVWRGARHAELRLPPKILATMEAALPQSTETDELRRSLRALVLLYADARDPLAHQLGVQLSDDLMVQVRRHVDHG